MMAVIAPWTIRNYGTTGHFVPVSSGTSDAFLRGMIFSRSEFITLQRAAVHGGREREQRLLQSDWRSDAGTVWERDDYETDQILNKEAKRVIAKNRFRWRASRSSGSFTFWYQLTSFKNSLLVLALRHRRVGARDRRLAAGPPRAAVGLATAAARVLPEHRARAVAGARAVLGADLAGPARGLGVRRRHPHRTVAARVRA